MRELYPVAKQRKAQRSRKDQNGVQVSHSGMSRVRSSCHRKEDGIFRDWDFSSGPAFGEKREDQ